MTRTLLNAWSIHMLYKILVSELWIIRRNYIWARKNIGVPSTHAWEVRMHVCMVMKCGFRTCNWVFIASFCNLWSDIFPFTASATKSDSVFSLLGVLWGRHALRSLVHITYFHQIAYYYLTNSVWFLLSALLLNSR